MIMQLFKSHAVMPGKYLPSTAPAQHVGPPSHPHAGCPASNSQLPPPGDLLTISPQSPWLLPAGLTLCPFPRSPAGFGAVMGCCSAQHPACLLPRRWQQQQGFRAGLSEAFVQAVVQGSFFFSFSQCFWQGVRIRLPAARCCKLLGIWQAALPCLLTGDGESCKQPCFGHAA